VTAPFWDITECVVVIYLPTFGTTYRSSFQGSRVFCLEYGADLLSRNLGKELPVYCAYIARRAQFSFQSNNNFTLKLRWHQQLHNCTFHF